MATHSKVLAWRIMSMGSWTEEPDGLQPIELQWANMTEVTYHAPVLSWVNTCASSESGWTSQAVGPLLHMVSGH